MEWSVTRQEIVDTPLPTHKGRYGVIPHELFLNTVADKITSRGYGIIDERFLTNKDNQVLSGTYTIGGYDDIDITPSIYFVNSYNKSKIASIRIGGMVLVCKNGMLSSRVYSRKHLGAKAYEDFSNQIDKGLDKLDEDFNNLIINKNEMKSLTINKDTIHKLVSDMFLEEDLITSTQISILKRELKYSKNFKDDTVWSFYNNVTESLKSNSASNYNAQLSKFHAYASDYFDLTNKPNLYFKNKQLS